jgi:uncharacterized membrane protein
MRTMNASTTAYLIGYGVAAIVMLALDALWLTLTAGSFYRRLLGDIMLDGFRPAPAVAFYVLYLCGIVVFAVHPAFASGRWITATVYGALFGFFAYATYDLTNHATLRTWSTLVTIVDMAWGCVLTAVAATAAYLAAAALTR